MLAEISDSQILAVEWRPSFGHRALSTIGQSPAQAASPAQRRVPG